MTVAKGLVCSTMITNVMIRIRVPGVTRNRARTCSFIELRELSKKRANERDEHD